MIAARTDRRSKPQLVGGNQSGRLFSFVAGERPGQTSRSDDDGDDDHGDDYQRYSYEHSLQSPERAWRQTPASSRCARQSLSS